MIREMVKQEFKAMMKNITYAARWSNQDKLTTSGKGSISHKSGSLNQIQWTSVALLGRFYRSHTHCDFILTT